MQYSDVIIRMMASQIHGVNVVHLIVCSDADQRKHHRLCEGNSPVTAEFPAQRASNAENVYIFMKSSCLTQKQAHREVFH